MNKTEYNLLEIGQRIRRLRGPLSQKEFAAKLGISFRTYQNYEAGKRMPHARVLNEMARMLSLPVEWILTGKKPTGLLLSSAEIKELETLELKRDRTAADIERMHELWMEDARAQVRNRASIEGIELSTEREEDLAKEYMAYTVSGMIGEKIKTLGIHEETSTFQVSLKGQIAAHNRPILEKMMQQLADIMAEGDYRKTGALQSLLDLLAPKKEEGEVK